MIHLLLDTAIGITEFLIRKKLHLDVQWISIYISPLPYLCLVFEYLSLNSLRHVHQKLSARGVFSGPNAFSAQADQCSKSDLLIANAKKSIVPNVIVGVQRHCPAVLTSLG